MSFGGPSGRRVCCRLIQRTTKHSRALADLQSITGEELQQAGPLFVEWPEPNLRAFIASYAVCPQGVHCVSTRDGHNSDRIILVGVGGRGGSEGPRWRTSQIQNSFVPLMAKGKFWRRSR